MKKEISTEEIIRLLFNFNIPVTSRGDPGQGAVIVNCTYKLFSSFTLTLGTDAQLSAPVQNVYAEHVSIYKAIKLF